MSNRLRTVFRSMAGIPLVFYGFALQKTWTSIDAFPPTAINDVLPMEISGLRSALFAIILAVAAATVGGRALSKALFPISIVAQVASALFLAIGWLTPAPSLPFMLLGVMVQAAGAILMSALWIELYSTLNPMRATFLNAGAIVISVCIVFFIETSAPERVFVASLVFPILTAIFYLLSRKHEDATFKIEPSSPSKLTVPVKEFLFIAACSFAYGVASVSIEGTQSRQLTFVPALLVVGMILLNTKNFSLTTLSKVTFPLILAGFLLLTLFSEDINPFSSILLGIGYGAMEIFLILTVCTFSYKTGVSAFWLFGVLAAAEFLSRAAGAELGAVLSTGAGSDSIEYRVVEFVAIALMIATVVLMVSNSSRAPGSFAENELSSADPKKTRIANLSEAYSLTDRETEILYLIAEGRNNAQIAQDLFISDGTARAHLHHIYRKLDVHSRKELNALVDEKDAGRRS